VTSKKAKMLVEGGFVDSVSIGFSVKGYDPVDKTILESELYETSLVAVPANPDALIDSRKQLKEQEEQVTKIENTLSHYKKIKPVWDFMRDNFYSDKFCELIGYEKKGDLLVDINDIYEVVLDKFKATPETTSQVAETTSQETSEKTLTQGQLTDVIKQVYNALKSKD
jgi:hypothetical protein